jgi:hypothetical protein
VVEEEVVEEVVVAPRLDQLEAELPHLAVLGPCLCRKKCRKDLWLEEKQIKNYFFFVIKFRKALYLQFVV